MTRRALIVYCDDTESGELEGPARDNENYERFLKSYLGGEWHDHEIESLHNPTAIALERMRNYHLNGADYTFVIFSGHGCINTNDENLQYAELADGDVSVRKFRTDANRQTIIFDACRGRSSFVSAEMLKAVNEDVRMFAAGQSTRALFDRRVQEAEEGLSILYAASENQSAWGGKGGSVYLLSLLRVAEEWAKSDGASDVLRLNAAHQGAAAYIRQNSTSIQKPVMAAEKRMRYFPFAVKVKTRFVYG